MTGKKYWPLILEYCIAELQLLGFRLLWVLRKQENNQEDSLSTCKI